MRSSSALFAVFSVLLVGSTIAARMEPGHRKDGGAVSAAECHTGTEEARKEEAEELLKDFGHKVEKVFEENFEPRPNVSVYHDDEAASQEDKGFVKDFEPRPNVSVYHDDEAASKEDKGFVKDFEASPNVSVYND